MFNREQAVEELTLRQNLRKEANLPLLDIDKLLVLMEKESEVIDRMRSYQDWIKANPEIVATTEKEVLEKLRVRWGKPADWVPTGILSGGRMWYVTEVRNELQKKFEAR